MAPTAATATSPASELSAGQRAEVVRRLCTDLTEERLDTGTALLLLDILGLTGDRDALGHAIAARYMRDGLADGSISVGEVDPRITIGLDVARDLLVQQYDDEYEAAVATLAAVRDQAPATLTVVPS